ncbi:hypothetical protein PHMEG_00017781 [Phytophthora megakarya]|uniref:Uncharacterized protein n=1 Tax=Phytophthora megakarya TaxID=4795 RepID=A0A225VX03_9STRA|nr:hypothetical protein PHMEG_00017781 [Phytophthora megakarya]
MISRQTLVHPVNAGRLVVKKPRGSWELIAAVDSTAFSKNAKMLMIADNANSLHTSARHTHFRVSFPLEPETTSCFFNDLASTPSARVLGGGYSEVISCYHGLYPIRRWTENRGLHRQKFMAPTIVAVYNIAINGVDRMAQLQSTNPTKRKEK